MHIRVCPFWVPKHGNCEHEYEDAFWPCVSCDYDSGPIRLAVADGATESSYSRFWAERLVRAVGDGLLTRHRFSDGVAALRSEWDEAVNWPTLPWYAEEKARQGAFAAFIALELDVDSSDGSPKGCWQAMAMGDSCVFQTRGSTPVARFPIETSTSFLCRPHLLASIPIDGDVIAAQLLTRQGSWVQGDYFYLMSDALACWFLRGFEDGADPGEPLRQLASSHGAQDFSAWIADLRGQGAIRNDDTTVLVIEVS